MGTKKKETTKEREVHFFFEVQGKNPFALFRVPSSEFQACEQRC